MNSLRVAFLGLGLMGSGMAHRLLAAGFKVVVFNRSPERTASHAAAGAEVAPTPRDASVDADVIVSMVADDFAARAIWLGADGAIAGAKPGAVAVECSTVTLDWIHELERYCRDSRIEFLDAPVTGSRTHAVAGELNFLVGGSLETLDRIRSVLGAMGKSTMHLGPVGSGAMLKLVNNFVCGVQIASLAEAIAMIERSGLDRTSALDLLTGGAPGSPLVKAISTRIIQSDYSPHFRLRLMAKDLTFAMKVAAGLSLDLRTGRAALDICQRGLDMGLGDEDMAAVIEPLRRKQLK